VAQRPASAYDELPDAVVVVDSTGVVIDANAAAVRILATSRSQLLGAALGEAVPLLDPQGRDWWVCTDPFGGLSTRVRQPEQLLRLSGPGGADRDLLVTASYVRDDAHRLVRVVICLRGPEGRGRSERSSAELVSTVAHELRSPLTGVKGFTSTLLSQWDRFDDEQKLHMLRTVDADADRLARLISELLDASRIETGRLELHREEVDVPALVGRDVAGRVAAGEPAERFVTVVDAGLPWVRADPGRLAQVVSNLVENALRHGSGQITITISRHDDGVRVEVADQGGGIPSETLPRMFTKFWHDTRRGGTGLGLFVAKGIVDAHGGTIGAGDTAGGGAAVWFTIPSGDQVTT
jgi:signal transduction histidine kinase